MAMADQLTQFTGLPAPEQGPDPNAEHAQKLQQRNEEHQQKMTHKEDEHQQKLGQSVDSATLSRDERTQKMIDESADRDVQRDQKRADAARKQVEDAKSPFQ